MITANRRVPSWPLKIDPIVRGSVDVWCVSIQSLERRLEALSALLTPEEIAKAKAYKFERHRRRFCIARGMLRAMLGEYLGRSPADVALAHGAEGKPALAARAPESLHFNVSHSADLVVYTFCRDAEVGTDVEYLDRTLNRDLIVNRAFSQTELECYYGAGVEQRLRTFFQIWARKEARLKARGLRMAQLSEESLTRLPVVDFAFGENYVGAVAIRSAELPSVVAMASPTVPHRARADARALAA
jgi:4'-phosphopantetheinyl transferase